MSTMTMPAEAPVLRRAVVPLAEVELRDATGTGDGSHTLTGYAAVTGQATTLYEGRSWVWREVIAPGAFTDVLGDLRSGAATYPCVLNREHDMQRAIASTAVPASQLGGLELTEDGHGLRTFARLDATDPDVMALIPKVRNGVVSQMSFQFRVPPDGFVTTTETDDQGRTVETDTITRVSHLFDVTVCAHGAYPTTSAEIRGRLAAYGRSGIDPEGPAARRLIRGAAADNPDTAPDAPAGVGIDPRHRARLTAIRRRLDVALLTHSRKG